MAEMDAICARLCLLTRAAWRDGLPEPLSRATVRKMLRLGALSGLALRRLNGIEPAHYERAEALLSRSADISRRVENVLAKGYEVILPEDENWPVNLHALGMQMPQYLFVRGNQALLSRRSIAVAGSREIDERTLGLARTCAQSISNEGYTLVCGGAWGVDTAVQKAQLDAGGSLILVPAFPMRELLRQAYLKKAFEAGQLLLVCDTWPNEPFSASKALTRNHTIYALGDAALVVASRKGKGGSWRGAVDCLRSGCTPVFAVDAEGTDFAGNHALFELGAKRFNVSRPVGIQMFESGADTE